MIKPCLAALVAAALAQAETSSLSGPIQPSVDSAEQRLALRDLTACFAEYRPGWARRTLSQPYLSDAQARLAARALSGRDTCLRGDEVEMTFRTSTLVGSLAEHFVRTEIGRIDAVRLATALSTVEPLNASEDFALCVAARNPTAARQLALSEFGSAAEMQAGRQLASGVVDCTNAGEQLTVDLQSLRALAATALYRGVMAALPSETGTR